MKKLSLTKGEFAILDDDDFEKYGTLKWHISPKGKYSLARRSGPVVYLHHLILGRKPNRNEKTVFINDNSLDLRKKNIYYTNKSNKTNP